MCYFITHGKVMAISSKTVLLDDENYYKYRIGKMKWEFLTNISLAKNSFMIWRNIESFKQVN